jgi:hypothetical protein
MIASIGNVGGDYRREHAQNHLGLRRSCRHMPPLNQRDAAVVEAQKKIVAACQKHGVMAGIHNNGERCGQLEPFKPFSMAAAIG